MAGWAGIDEAIDERIGETSMNGAVTRLHEYVMTNGGVPDFIAQLLELDRKIGDKFVCTSVFDATFARGFLGLDRQAPAKLPDTERLRLANLLRRAEQISDEELAGLGMVARPVLTLLERIQPPEVS